MIKIMVPGEPVAQGRPRFNSYTKRAHDPAKSRKYKELVGYYAMRHKPNELFDCALAVEIDIFRSPPQSISKVKKNSLSLKNETLTPVTKPDVDNYAKGIKDALNGVIWTDDSKVVDLRVRKFYSLNPRAEIRVKATEE